MSILISLLVFCSAAAAARNHIVIALNPHRGELMQADVIAASKEIQAADSGDLVECMDNSGKDICRVNLVGGVYLLDQARMKRAAAENLKAYYKEIMQGRYASSGSINNVAATLNHIAEKMEFSQGFEASYAVIFDSGIHRTANYSFTGYIPSDSWATSPASPFSQIGKIPATVVMVVGRREFTNLDHKSGMKRFYALLASKLGGTLVAYTPEHGQLRAIIATGISSPIVQDLRVEDPEGELKLRTPMEIRAHQ
jgi:hypothetical protein